MTTSEGTLEEHNALNNKKKGLYILFSLFFIVFFLMRCADWLSADIIMKNSLKRKGTDWELSKVNELQ